MVINHKLPDSQLILIGISVGEVEKVFKIDPIVENVNVHLVFCPDVYTGYIFFFGNKLKIGQKVTVTNSKLNQAGEFDYIWCDGSKLHDFVRSTRCKIKIKLRMGTKTIIEKDGWTYRN